MTKHPIISLALFLLGCLSLLTRPTWAQMDQQQQNLQEQRHLTRRRRRATNLIQVQDGGKDGTSAEAPVDINNNKNKNDSPDLDHHRGLRLFTSEFGEEVVQAKVNDVAAVEKEPLEEVVNWNDEEWGRLLDSDDMSYSYPSGSTKSKSKRRSHSKTGMSKYKYSSKKYHHSKGSKGSKGSKSKSCSSSKSKGKSCKKSKYYHSKSGW